MMNRIAKTKIAIKMKALLLRALIVSVGAFVVEMVLIAMGIHLNSRACAWTLVIAILCGILFFIFCWPSMGRIDMMYRRKQKG